MCVCVCVCVCVQRHVRIHRPTALLARFLTCLNCTSHADARHPVFPSLSSPAPGSRAFPPRHLVPIAPSLSAAAQHVASPPSVHLTHHSSPNKPHQTQLNHTGKYHRIRPSADRRVCAVWGAQWVGSFFCFSFGPYGRGFPNHEEDFLILSRVLFPEMGLLPWERFPNPKVSLS